MFIFFFFQAEDGIRDGTVTGVQTCALPIFLSTQGDENLILVLMAPFGLIIRRFPLTSRVPDLAVFLKKNIVEVLSSANTRLERAGNLRDYEQGRVPEVWVLHSGSANCRSARV